jgi:hypothetical protein
MHRFVQSQVCFLLARIRDRSQNGTQEAVILTAANGCFNQE